MSVPSHPETPDALATFGVLAGPNVGATLPVRTPVATIGQGPQNDVVVDDDSVSKTHARLDYEHGGWHLTDLDSTNGTVVEGVRLAPRVPTPVLYGNSIRFGGVALQFREVPSADPAAARATFAPAAPPTPAARRARLPVWLFLVLLLMIAAVVYFALNMRETAAPTAAPTETVSLLRMEEHAPPTAS